MKLTQGIRFHQLPLSDPGYHAPDIGSPLSIKALSTVPRKGPPEKLDFLSPFPERLRLKVEWRPILLDPAPSIQAINQSPEEEIQPCAFYDLSSLLSSEISHLPRLQAVEFYYLDGFFEKQEPNNPPYYMPLTQGFASGFSIKTGEYMGRYPFICQTTHDIILQRIQEGSSWRIIPMNHPHLKGLEVIPLYGYSGMYSPRMGLSSCQSIYARVVLFNGETRIDLYSIQQLRERGIAPPHGTQRDHNEVFYIFDDLNIEDYTRQNGDHLPSQLKKGFLTFPLINQWYGEAAYTSFDYREDMLHPSHLWIDFKRQET